VQILYFQQPEILCVIISWETFFALLLYQVLA
jgi:hypothetical protein